MVDYLKDVKKEAIIDSNAVQSYADLVALSNVYWAVYVPFEFFSIMESNKSNEVLEAEALLALETEYLFEQAYYETYEPVDGLSLAYDESKKISEKKQLDALAAKLLVLHDVDVETLSETEQWAAIGKKLARRYFKSLATQGRPRKSSAGLERSNAIRSVDDFISDLIVQINRSTDLPMELDIGRGYEQQPFRVKTVLKIQTIAELTRMVKLLSKDLNTRQKVTAIRTALRAKSGELFYALKWFNRRGDFLNGSLDTVCQSISRREFGVVGKEWFKRNPDC